MALEGEVSLFRCKTRSDDDWVDFPILCRCPVSYPNDIDLPIILVYIDLALPRPPCFALHRDDARRIAGLEDERSEHLATIAALQAQLAAAASTTQPLGLRPSNPASLAEDPLHRGRLADADGLLSPGSTPSASPLAEAAELIAELRAQKEAAQSLFLEARCLREERDQLERRCAELTESNACASAAYVSYDLYK